MADLKLVTHQTSLGSLMSRTYITGDHRLAVKTSPSIFVVLKFGWILHFCTSPCKSFSDQVRCFNVHFCHLINMVGVMRVDHYAHSKFPLFPLSENRMQRCFSDTYCATKEKKRVLKVSQRSSFNAMWCNVVTCGKIFYWNLKMWDLSKACCCIIMRPLNSVVNNSDLF